MAKQVVRTDLAPRPMGDYSQAWSVSGGRLVFVAGQTSVDANGNVVGVGDVATQTRTVLQNLRGVLQGAGAGLGDVIKVNIFVTNMEEYREKARDVRREYFPQDFPASTLVEVKSLARPEFMVEIEAVAAVG